MDKKLNTDFQSKNYVPWDEYLKKHNNISDIEKSKEIQKYEDQVFALVLRLFR